MKSLLFLATILSAHTVLAADWGQQLADAFKSRVVALDRDMITFRYETKDRKDLHTVDDVVGRITGWGDRFLDESVVTSDMMGPGNYVSIDPVATRSYGNNVPKLYVLTLKKGIRLLTLESGHNEGELKLLKAIHNDLHCMIKEGDVDKLIEERAMDFSTLRRSSTIACRAIAIKVTQKLKIDGIIYGYSASNGLKECRERSAAINVISSAAIDYDKTLYYSDDAAIEGSKYGGYVRKLYEEAKKDFSMEISQSSNYEMPRSLTKKSLPSDGDYLRWKKTYVYTCGSKWASEEKKPLITTAINESARKYYRDEELESLLLEFKKAFTAKAQGKDFFSLMSFPKIIKLHFMATGLPQDDETFKKWRLAKDGYYANPTYRADLKKMYKTKKLMDEVGYDVAVEAEKYLQSLPKNQIDSPDIYPRLWIHFGLSSTYAWMLLNEYNGYQGKALVISRDPKKSFAENLAISKSLYKKAVKECIKIYSDPKLTYEDTQKTDCPSR